MKLVNFLRGFIVKFQWAGELWYSELLDGSRQYHWVNCSVVDRVTPEVSYRGLQIVVWRASLVITHLRFHDFTEVTPETPAQASAQIPPVTPERVQHPIFWAEDQFLNFLLGYAGTLPIPTYFQLQAARNRLIDQYLAAHPIFADEMRQEARRRSPLPAGMVEAMQNPLTPHPPTVEPEKPAWKALQSD